MKKMLYLIIFFTAFAEGNAQNEKKIEISALVKITETSDFPALVKLVKNLTYEVIDSSKESNGSLIFISREKKINGNILGCTVTVRNKINHLSFSTWDVGTYETLKKQIKSFGFKSSGITKGHFPDILETEDFEKGKTLISTASNKKENDAIEYEFTFIRW